MLQTIGAVLTLYFVGKLIKANCGAGDAPSTKPKESIWPVVLVILLIGIFFT